jgi:hypothetical protein
LVTNREEKERSSMIRKGRGRHDIDTEVIQVKIAMNNKTIQDGLLDIEKAELTRFVWANPAPHPWTENWADCSYVAFKPVNNGPVTASCNAVA